MLISLLLPVSQAFAPQGPVLPDADGPRPLVTVEPERMFPVHPPVQRALARGDAWRAFLAGDGEGWSAIFDEHSGVPRTMWGRGIPMPADEAALVEAVLDLLERNAAVVGLGDGTLELAQSGYHAPSDTWYLHFDELRDGVPVYLGGVGARIKHGNLVLLQVATTQDRPVTGAWSWSADRAIEAAIAGGPAPDAAHTDTGAVRTGLDRTTLKGREVRRTWKVTTRTASPPGRWVSFVDAETGELLNVHNEVQFATGTVEAVHHERNPLTPLVTGPVQLATVDSGNGTGLTDAAGAYAVNDGASYTTTLQGDYLTVLASREPEGLLSGASPDLLWDTTSALQSEIDVYVHTHIVRDWALRVAPGVGIVNAPLTAWVNLDNTCNAFYDGNINFYNAGSGCNDTGENADVIYHEWGHGFHATSIITGNFSQSISEGVADVVAFLQTRDPVIAPGFNANGSGIREVATDKVYPQDFNANGPPHPNGLIFGGTFWDLLPVLEALEGIPQGTESTEHIFAGLLRAGPSITQVWGEALVADDDDGDLSNGTPHYCAMEPEFTRHGIGPQGGGGAVVIDHVPVDRAPAGLAIAVDVEVTDPSGVGCFGGAVNDGELHYRVDGGAWVDLPMTGAPVLTADIPAQPTGTLVEYFVTGTAVGPFAVPSGGVVTPYTVLVGDDIPIRCWDFEADDGGFAHALLGGKASAGADDWQWGNPAGRAEDPADAFSGDNVWGNDLGNAIGGNNFNGEYQNDKINILAAPAVPTGAYTDVMVAYRRWLSVEDATFDQAEILANDVPVWQNRVGSDAEHHIDDQWMNHVVRLGPATDQGEARVAWRLTTDGGLTFGGWTVDDVCIVAPATPDNRLAIDDLQAEVLSDTDVRLTWTHPAHAPVELVHVVRNFDAFPADHEDGMVIAEFVQPDPDTAASLDDVNYDKGDSYYAVYAYDGTDWLSWTVEGFNAVQVDLVGGVAPEGWPYYPQDTGATGDTGAPVDTGSGPQDTGSGPQDTGSAPPPPGGGGDGGGFLGELCGCSSASPRPAAALLLATLVLVGWRRRR